MMRQDVDHDILAKYFAGELSDDDQEKVLQWAKVSDENRRSFERLRQVMLSAAEIDDIFDEEVGWKEMKKRISKEQPGTIPTVWKVAASVALLTTVALLYFLIPTPAIEPTYLSSGKEIMEKVLPDGSVITLNSFSQLEVESDFGETNRLVELKGEAYFDVSKVDGQTFEVKVGSAMVTVLGTEFNIRTSDSSIAINVFEGRVSVSSANDSKVLEVGDRIEIGPNGILGNTLKYKLNDIFWKTGDLYFDSTPLESALLTIGSKFGQSIVLDVPDSKNCLLTTSFEDADLRDILEVITLTYGLEVSEMQGVIRLTGPGCD